MDIRKTFPSSSGHQVRSIPTLNNGVPQVIIKPDNLKLSEYGITAKEFSIALDVYNDGLRVSEIPFEGRLIDMTLLSSKRNLHKIDDLNNFSFVTNSGEIITLSQVARCRNYRIAKSNKTPLWKKGLIHSIKTK